MTRDLAGPPPADVDIPAEVAALAAGEPVVPVWRNEVGGLTFRVGGRRFAKWSPLGDLAREAARLRWAIAFTPVPRVLDAGDSWLLTEAVDGESAVSARWSAEPATAVAAVGEGLRAMHDALPVEACPFSWSVDDRVARAGINPIGGPPPVERLVVCHGDACAPNTLLDAGGRWCAHVDLGALGVADRWADLAVATWSTEWNYGPGWEAALLDAYGVDPDPARTEFYRRLWDAT